MTYKGQLQSILYLRQAIVIANRDRSCLTLIHLEYIGKHYFCSHGWTRTQPAFVHATETFETP
jgi:hypothetical protein